MRRRKDDEATPQAIDPRSGFKVPLSNLVRQYDGDLIDYRFADRRNPQDFVRGRADNMRLPFYRPEPPDRFIAQPIEWESGPWMQLEELSEGYIMSEGVIVRAEDL